jgi:hypothetical protein
MGYLKIIYSILSMFKQIFDFSLKTIKHKKRVKEIKEVREFEKEVKEKVENGAENDIIDLNKKLRF